MRLFKLLLWKAYFDKGFSLTNYFKYVLLLFGWGTGDVRATIVVGVVWALVCLILGRVWFHYKIIETEHEIDNIFNPFAQEVRKHIKGKNL